MAEFKYSLFYDFHTLVTNPDVGKEFDAEAFTDQVKACGVDFLTFHARCNQGNAYYNTRIGTRHPSLHYDLVRQLCDCCKKKGIRLSLYFNGHLSEEETLAHPEWLDVPLNVKDRDNMKTSPFYHQVCYNSAFGEHLMHMMLELLENYDFDGFFLDCLGASDCVCPKCVREMKERGMDWTDIKDVRRFSHLSAERMCRMIYKEISKVKPDVLFFMNGRPWEEVIDMESHLECECLPTGGWGYDCLPTCAHYMRAVTGPGKGVLNMTGVFNSWGDFGGLRTAESLEYDLFYGVANGMRPDLSWHYHPRGDIYMPVFDRMREVYENLRRYDKWSLDAKNEYDVAVVYPRYEMCYYPQSPSSALVAATRLLDECKVQFDVVSEFAFWDKYRLLIFPDDAVFTEEMVRRVEAHLAKGGAVIASGDSGLDAAKKGFAVKGWPVKYVSDLEYDPLYFRPAGRFAEGLPEMPLSVYAKGTKVIPEDGAEVEMPCVKPYVNRGWDGIRGNYYIPPQGDSGDPFLVKKGNFVYISGKIFAGFFQRAPQQFKVLFMNIFRELHPQPLLETKGLPSFARAIVQTKEKYILVNLFAYAPEQRCSTVIVEDRITVLDAELSVRTGKKKISKVYLAPGEEPLPFECKDGVCKVKVPRFDGYALVVFEE